MRRTPEAALYRPGLGTMTLTGGYGPVAAPHALQVLRHALDNGVALLDTADVYPGGEPLIARALIGRANRPMVVTKCGLTGEPGKRVPCGRPDHLSRACAASGRRLGVETIDAVLLHRVDPLVPVEESIGALADLRDRGLIGRVGISTPDPDVVRRAAATTPLAFVEASLSVLAPEPVEELLPAVREAGATFLAHSPLFRGLAAKPAPAHGFDAQDARSHIPELGDPARLCRAQSLARIADRCGLSPAELALGWLSSLGSDVVPIPGTRTLWQLRQNLRAQRPLPPTVVMEIASLKKMAPARPQMRDHPPSLNDQFRDSK